MAQTAWDKKMDPDKLSFIRSVQTSRRKLPQIAAFPPEMIPNWRHDVKKKK
jgi:hypothetical protein